MKSHVVFGAGLIGCYLGGVLSSKGLNVALVCKQGVQNRLSNGLKLTDYEDNKLLIPKVNFLHPESIQNAAAVLRAADFLWLTVKCNSVEQACIDMAPLVGPQTVILCCQNGLGSERLIKKHFPANMILRVMVPFNVVEIKPGHLHRGSQGSLCIETAEPTIKLAELLNSPIMPVTLSNNMSAMLWAKLQLNLGNSINALADRPVKTMLQQRSYRLVIAAMMKELLAVTTALNIDLPKVTALPARILPLVLSLPDFIFKLVANKMLAIDPNVRTSMWWDLSQGKQTEIDYLNGAIVDNAINLDISCPVNTKIINLIKRAQQTNQDKGRREVYEGEALLELVLARNDQKIAGKKD
jgi:2-dehydropantoate 2-reductase